MSFIRTSVQHGLVKTKESKLVIEYNHLNFFQLNRKNDVVLHDSIMFIIAICISIYNSSI